MIGDKWSDLSVDVFVALRNRFFDAGATPKSYVLRDKRNTQDDPLDEHICQVLRAALPKCVSVDTRGPLTTPDLVVHRQSACNRASKADLNANPHRIIALEVKKLERGASGRIARASGLDYNTTPPCGTVRIYDLDGSSLDVKGCYLFLCQESVPDLPRTYRLTSLVLCDGNLLNEDFGYYTSIVGRRSKETGLGTYGDGANRVRPMLIFSNPLGARFLDRRSTLIHVRDDLEVESPTLWRVGAIERTIPYGRGFEPVTTREPVECNPSGDSRLETRTFHCYRDRRDVAPGEETFYERDPFPTPKRSTETAPRGRFVIEILPAH